jgi:mono/diheme cytochrome c family protein
VRALRGAGTTVAAALDGGLAISKDGVHLAIAKGVVQHALAAARKRIALVDGALEVWDLDRDTRVSYPIANALAVAFVDAESDAPHVVAATATTIYIERDGKLHELRAPATVTALAASGARAWIATAAGLYILDRGALVRTDARAFTGALYGSPTGGVWIAGDHLAHYQIDVAAEDVAWNERVAPVFQRVCSHCHLPGGDAGIDLSTVAAWNAERAEIQRRVMVTRTMPPAGTDLSETDRAALAGWLDAKTPR